MRRIFSSFFKKEDEVTTDDPPPPPPPVPQKSIEYIPEPEVILKITVIGGSAVGKTSIIRRYLQGCFTHQYLPTIGIDMASIRYQPKRAGDTIFRIQFYDVSYAEVRGHHHVSLFKGAAGVVMVFDSSNVKSVTAVDEWRMAYEESTKNKARIPMVLLAHKADAGPPIIRPADLDSYCERGGYALWQLTTARSGNSVQEAIEKLLDLILDQREKAIMEQSVRRKPEKLISSKSQLIMDIPRSPVRSPSMSRIPALPPQPSLQQQPQPQSQQPQQQHDDKNAHTNNDTKPNGTTTTNTTSPSPRNSTNNNMNGDNHNNNNNINSPILTPIITPVPSIASFTDAFGVDEIKMSELKNIVEAFYAQLKVDLYTLFQNVGPDRKADLQILEFQRFDEYSKLIAALAEKTDSTLDKSPRKLSKEHIQIMLSENMKKWNQLIMNLHTEVSLSKSLEETPRIDPISLLPHLDLQSIDLSLDPMMLGEIMEERDRAMTSSSSHSSSSLPSPSTQMKNSASDSMLYRYDTPTINTNNNDNSNSNSNSQTPNLKSKSHESSIVNSVNHSGHSTPPSDEMISGSGSTNSVGERKDRSARKSRMGFGFRNAGRTPAILANLVAPPTTITGFLLDNDNPSSPPSLSSSVSSSVSSSSPISTNTSSSLPPKLNLSSLSSSTAPPPSPTTPTTPTTTTTPSQATPYSLSSLQYQQQQQQQQHNNVKLTSIAEVT